jgi:hypothetical protein
MFHFSARIIHAHRTTKRELFAAKRATVIVHFVQVLFDYVAERFKKYRVVV